MIPEDALLHFGSVAVIVSFVSVMMRPNAIHRNEIGNTLERLRETIRGLALRLDMPVGERAKNDEYMAYPLYNSLRAQLLFYIAGDRLPRSAFYFLPFIIYREARVPLLWYFRRGFDQVTTVLLFGFSSIALCVAVAGDIWGWQQYSQFAEIFSHYAFWLFSAVILMTLVHVLAVARLQNLDRIVGQLACDLEREVQWSLEREVHLSREKLSDALSRIASLDSDRGDLQ